MRKSFFFIIYTYMPKILYNTRLEKELIKEFKILAIRQEKRQNELLEEAIQDLFKKYEKKAKEWPLIKGAMDWISKSRSSGARLGE